MPFRASFRAIRTPVLILAVGGGAAGYGAYRWHSTSSESTSLNDTTFTPYTLIAKQPVSSTSSVFTLRYQSSSSDKHDANIAEALKSRGCIWSVQVKQPQLQIARSYTPLPASQDAAAADGDIRLLIRREEYGEVSGYLHRQPVQSTLELRGPHDELCIPDAVTDVLFLAGGTGIAPAMQVADILSGRSGARCRILWASRRREECAGGSGGGSHKVSQGLFSGWRSLFGLEENVVASEEEIGCTNRGVMVQELEALKRKAEGRVQVEYFVDDEKTFIRPAYICEHLRHSQSAQGVQEGGQKLILVSGPDGFIEHWAGKKVWVGGHETQGPLHGVLGELELKDWRVWKL